ncbi:sigma factor (plasmid) [Enterocloster clostridioformis]
MEDDSIVNLYWTRSENAISETSKKYGNYCYSIAYNILGNAEDADESVNDTYLDAWNNIPPHHPSILSTFLGKITRRISIDKWRSRNAKKRGGGEIVLVLDELSDCIPSNQNVEHEVEAAELA